MEQSEVARDDRILVDPIRDLLGTEDDLVLGQNV